MARAAPRIPRDLVKWSRKPGRLRRPDHRRWIKTLPCICCGGFPCDPAHVRMNSAEHGNYNTMGDKSEDKFIVPLCAQCHRIDQHVKFAEPEFWARLGIDPLDFALQLYRNSGDDDAGLRTIMRAHQSIALHKAALVGEG